mmetsp:Transcript_22412/g.42087  ORF Transcript_22412/g.42087 Transcript_22412/m.42087 type:complete len:255 (-) Transcript_22412:256-1020(-)
MARSTVLREGVITSHHRWRGEARKALEGTGCPLRFPLLVDETAGVTIPGSRDIIRHLWQHYGDWVAEEEVWGADDVTSWLERTAWRHKMIHTVFPFTWFGTRVENGVHLLTDGDLLRLTLLCAQQPITGVFLARRTPLMPYCALMQDTNRVQITLWGCEDCKDTAFWRAQLCAHQIPHTSVPCAEGSSHLEDEAIAEMTATEERPSSLPILEVRATCDDPATAKGVSNFVVAMRNSAPGKSSQIRVHLCPSRRV